jgi:hypothetical protein
MEEVLARLVPEAPDHGAMITRLPCYNQASYYPPRSASNDFGFNLRWLGALRDASPPLYSGRFKPGLTSTSSICPKWGFRFGQTSLPHP